MVWIISKKHNKAKRESDLKAFREYTARMERFLVIPGMEAGQILFMFSGYEYQGEDVPMRAVRVHINLTPEEAISVAAQLTEEVWHDGMRGVDGAELSETGVLTDQPETEETA